MNESQQELEPREPCTASQVIIDRYRALLVRDFPRKAGEREPDPEDVAWWKAGLSPEGRWGDIDYDSENGGYWRALTHLRRVRIMALVWGWSGGNDDGLEEAIRRGAGFWARKRFQNPNWWQNQIGVPKLMADILVVFGAKFSRQERDAANGVLRQLVVQGSGGGANTVWSAGLGLIAAALDGDCGGVADAAALIAGEIVIGGEQGIQDDFSFHQHGTRLQQFHYGGDFLKDTVRFGWLLRGTAWGFSQNKCALLADYALEGCAWMSRGRVTVPGTIDRAVSRPGFLETDLGETLRQLCELCPERTLALRAYLHRQDGGGEPLKGFRSFPRSDFVTFHTREFSFFLKLTSVRTELTESILGENLKGRKMNWGDHAVLRHGMEYRDLPPVWDWDLLPGVTSTGCPSETLQRREFVGSIDDGRSGAAAMDYRLSREEVTTLSARKLWAAHDGAVAFLTRILRSNDRAARACTAIDQRALVGAVTVADGRGVSVVQEGAHELRGVRWVHHDGLLYQFLKPAEMTLKIGVQVGSWWEINRNYSEDPVALPVFLPIWKHEEGDSESGYVIRSCQSASDECPAIDRRSCRILSNEICQAVGFANGACFAAFYGAGVVELDGGGTLAVNRACLIALKESRLIASDPTRRGGVLEIAWGGRNYTLSLPSDGRSSGQVF